MNIRSNLIKKQFAEEMKRCCLDRYSTIPSNEQMARDFYSATNYKLSINRETFRKWMRGDAFPDLDHLLYLIEWLNLDMVNVFKVATKQTSPDLNLCFFDKNLIANLNQDNLNSLVHFINIMKEKIKNAN